MNHAETPRKGWPFVKPLVVIAIVVVLVVLVIGLLSLSVTKVREAAARSQSANNIKSIGLAFRNTAQSSNLPPSYGNYPGTTGPKGSAFFHILSAMESSNIFPTYSADPAAIPTTLFIRSFYTPLDASNPGDSSLTSYATNACLLGTTPGGSVRFADMKKTKGESQTVLVVERFAQTGVEPNTIQHRWPSIGKDQSCVYEDFFPDAAGRIPVPIFGATPETAAVDNTAHAFSSSGLQVGMADGSARTVVAPVTDVGGVSGHPQASVWSWACAGPEDPLAASPTPKGW